MDPRGAAIADYRGQIDAINKSQAVIEFSLDGKILHANRNFLNALGYSLEEIKGQHHSMFAEPGYRQSAEYRLFWEKLGRGEFDAGEYKRIGKGGKEIWIRASYNPIFDGNGKAYKVVKYATDVTEQKLRNADYKGQLAAISKAQAVIEFSLDGTIRHANENFLNALGYSLDEIKGKHHGMFVEPAYRQSAEYRNFWEKLGRGEYRSRSIQAGRQGRQRDLDPGELQPDLRHERQAVQGREVRNGRHRAGEGERDAAIDRPADPGRRSRRPAATICPGAFRWKASPANLRRYAPASMVCSTPWRRW